MGIAQHVEDVKAPFSTSVRVGRLMLHTPSLGYDVLVDDFNERLQDESFWIDGERLMVYKHGIGMLNASVLILENAYLCQDTGPSRYVPSSWMAL